MTTDTLSYCDVKVGAALPSRAIPITTSLIVSGALATRDYEPVHHDRAAAEASGMPDVFMNILTSQGLMETFVTDWSGPEAVIKKLAVRLGAPNIPGTTMTITGSVSRKEDGLVEVSVKGDNDRWGNHMTGTVTIALPR